MKTEISSLELHFLVEELQSLVSSKVEQIYQVQEEGGDLEFLFQFHLPGEGKRLLRIIMGKVLYLASNKGEAPDKPPNFCLYLRKKLKNARLRSISQEGFERVVNMLFETKDAKFNLHIELFSKGNMILADESDTVLSALQYQEWKDRSIKPKKPYVPPQRGFNFLSLSAESLKAALLASEKENLVKTLAIDVGLGGVFAEELCSMADIDKNVKSSSLSDGELSRLFSSSQDLLHKELSPVIIYKDVDKDSSPQDILPFSISHYDGLVSRPFSSFNDAIDFVLTKKVDSSRVDSVAKESKTRQGQVDEIIHQQRLRIEGLETSEKENQRKGEIIYENYASVDELLRQVKELRKDHSWSEIKALLKSNSLVKSVDEKTGDIVLEL
ncbi:TPA: hypothetical protein HA265_00805 [Candidatus Woesearchaeota archaeon]|nr:hypothetical protein [Candidatus Woesearchaeota archaeon]